MTPLCGAQGQGTVFAAQSVWSRLP
uniref:Uncharacterized protein n=1 Tax=Ralstonia solanacearum TaxID=305 RepID=A0A0S4TUZ4_RALSL|nr:protein of unknown function [Ralstonia solanacearum]